MTLASTGALVELARAARRAVVAFNVITLEHAEAVVAGAVAAERGVIVQISQNCVRFHDGVLPLAAAVRALAVAAPVDVAVHLDHVDDPALLLAAVEAGVSSVMVDGSQLAYDSNVCFTAEAVAWAHDRGLWVEGELGEVGGKPGAHAHGARTDPAQAASFVADTGVDALAVAVGSTHAMTSRTASLDHELIASLARSVPVPLVLHGSSGVPDDELRRAVAGGLTKINVGTLLNVAYTDGLRASLAAHPDTVDPRPHLTTARTATTTAVTNLLTALTPPP